MKKLYLIIIIVLILGVCFYLIIKTPEKCTPEKCDIIKTCELQSDCIISCGCECVSKESRCPIETKIGMCPIGGLPCGCLNGTCTYAHPEESNFAG
jgi:hypothetical protein